MSACSDITVVVGCRSTAAGVKSQISIHYEYRTNTAGDRTLHATRYTDAAGVPFAADPTDVIVPGACSSAGADVEFERLCDVSAAGVATEFVRRAVTTFDANNIPSTVVDDLALDYTTAYVVAGTVKNCASCTPATALGVVSTWGV